MQGCRPAPFTGLSARFGMTSFFTTNFTSSTRRLRAGLSCDIVRELLCLRLSNPALKRRAIVGRPYGTGALRGVSCLGVPCWAKSVPGIRFKTKVNIKGDGQEGLFHAGEIETKINVKSSGRGRPLYTTISRRRLGRLAR